MIVLDTSALVAIVLREPEADACQAGLERDGVRCMSAATLMEVLVVAGRRKFAGEMERLIDGLDAEVAPVTAVSARRAAAAYERWGKGVHPARLNLVDCFAYELAQARRAPLLYVGSDFAQTDVASALPGAATS